MKARLLDTFIFLLFSCFIHAQEDSKILSDSASKYFLTKKYEKALPFYLKILTINNKTHTDFYAYKQVGTCYDKIGDYNTAIFYYKEALDKFVDSLNVLKLGQNTCVDIANCYYNLSLLDSCKIYLDRTQHWKRGLQWHGYSPTFHQTLFHTYMKYYNRRNLLDSAINIFAPHAFDEWTDNQNTYPSTDHIHENDYHCKVIDFINLLKKKYTVTEIKTELYKSVETIYYDLVLDKERSSEDTIYNIYCHDSYTFFFGVKIDLSNSCTYYKKTDKSFSLKKEVKEGQKKSSYYIKASLLYRLFESGCISDTVIF